MKKERRSAIRRHLGPIGLSLLASALTAAGFAAFSLADNGGGNDGSGGTGQVLPAPPMAGAIKFAPDLSAADRQKMEEFQQCMQDNGAPGPPPDPSRIDPGSGPPKPPTAAEQQQIQHAWEACKDKLPEALRSAGPPRIAVGPCTAPAPGAPAKPQNQDQSNDSSGHSSGSNS
jgi:hypothetical protein